MSDKYDTKLNYVLAAQRDLMSTILSIATSQQNYVSSLHIPQTINAIHDSFLELTTTQRGAPICHKEAVGVQPKVDEICESESGDRICARDNKLASVCLITVVVSCTTLIVLVVLVIFLITHLYRIRAILEKRAYNPTRS